MVITYKGKVEKDSMKGEADFGGLATGPWSAVPHKEGAAAPQRCPRHRRKQAGQHHRRLERRRRNFRQAPAIQALHSSRKARNSPARTRVSFGESPLTGTVKGSDITFTIKINAQART